MREQRCGRFLGEEDEALTFLSLVLKPGHLYLIGRCEFAIKYHDDCVVMFEGTLRSIFDDFASSVNAILSGKNVFALAKDSHFRSFRSIPH
jgi:hypothetical protein